MKRYLILPLFIPFYGCENRCIYCNQNLITGEEGELLDSVERQLAGWLTRGKQWDEIAFYGGTFAGLSKDCRKKLYELARPLSLPIRVSTCPDSISDEFISEIQKYHIKTVELGVQSLSESVLAANGRNYRPADVFSVFERLASLVDTSAQFMPGMYKETREDLILTAENSSILKATYARIYPTVVLQDTQLFFLYKQGDFVPLSASEMLLRTTWLYICLEAAGTKVIRVGLPPEAEGIVAGFVHPAMGALVQTLIVAAYALTSGKLPSFLSGGYKGALKKFSLPQEEGVATIHDVCLRLKEDLGEGGEWFSQKQIASFACGLVS